MALDYLKSNYITSVHKNIEFHRSSRKRANNWYFTKLCTLIVALIITFAVSYNLWMPKILAETTTVRQGLTAIIHDADKPSAIIDGQIVYIGDSIRKSKVTKINAGCVTLTKADKTYQIFLR